MKALLLTALTALCVPCKANVDYNKLHDAIAQVENGAGRIGPCGERGPTQIMPYVWRQHSKLPFKLASIDEYEPRRVTIAHLQWMATQIQNPTPYRLALAWHIGIHALDQLRVSDKAANYAERVWTLYKL